MLVRAKTIVPCATGVAQNGVSFEALRRVDGAAMLVEGGRIVALGRDADVAPLAPRGEREIDLRDCVIVPGFVDAHSHPLFAGDREADFAARLRGEAAPLGMLHTVERTRAALRDVPAFTRGLVAPRLRAMLAHGTTTLEVKTGYALEAEGELLLLDVIRSLESVGDVPHLVATLLGAHAVPPEFADDETFVSYLIERVVPFARERGAVYGDAFCEPGFFSVKQTRRYLEACRARGLRLRVHCDEMEFGGGAELAAQLSADAADHCNVIRDGDVRALAAAGTVLVACPATIAYLGLQRRAPVRAFLEAGGVAALASDYNPGTSPCFNLQTVAYFGRSLFGLSAAEALYGVTVAAARSLRVDAGTLRVGGAADFTALRIASPEEFGWQFGGNLAAYVCKDGAPSRCHPESATCHPEPVEGGA